MICHRSLKHTDGYSTDANFKNITEQQMFIPPVESFTEFKLGDKVYLFNNGDYEYHEPYKGSGTYMVPPAGTVFTITQDSLV